MGVSASSTSSLVNYEYVKQSNSVLIHIMEENQRLLIAGTLTAQMETERINDLMSTHEYDTKIIVYGKNGHDYESLLNKQKQLKSLGFKNVYIYLGGMFEWLLLQDVYGTKEFSTTSGIKPDPLAFMPSNQK
jgi:rhodanese-related sulfurtransferase